MSRLPAGFVSGVRALAIALAMVMAAFAGSAHAQEPAASAPPAPGEAPSPVEEVVVTGERSGPGLWHVYRGSSQLWLFGTVSPLPKDMTWRSKQLESVLDGTDQLLVAKLVDISAPRALWLMVTQRKLMMADKGKTLKDMIPADLHARFAIQRAKFTKDNNKWEKYRPIVAAAFMQEEAFEQAGLSTRLDLPEEVRSLAKKHRVHIDEFKVAGWRDVLDALKSIPPETEDKCVAASLGVTENGIPRLIERAQAWATGDFERIESLPEPPELAACRIALTSEAGAGDIYMQLRRAWLDNMERHLQSGGVTLAAVSIDMLLEPGGFLDELRKRGYTVDSP
jgi:uncharacterized protein YbaP (TraB family)